MPQPVVRASTTSPSVRLAAEAAGLADGPIEVAELQAAFTHEELLLRHVLGFGDDVSVNPSAALRSNPIMATGLCRIGYAADHIFGGGTWPSATRRRTPPATEPDLHPGGSIVSHLPCAIVGVGQTHHKSRRLDVSFGGLVREAVFRRSTTPR